MGPLDSGPLNPGHGTSGITNMGPPGSELLGESTEVLNWKNAQCEPGLNVVLEKARRKILTVDMHNGEKEEVVRIYN